MATQILPSATVLQFPMLPGNPEDPILDEIRPSLFAADPLATETDARAFVRAHAETERATAGMTREQRREYSIEQIFELLTEIHQRTGQTPAEARANAEAKMVVMAQRITEHRRCLGFID